MCEDVAPLTTMYVQMSPTTNLVCADVAPNTHTNLTNLLVSPGISTYSAAPPNTLYQRFTMPRAKHKPYQLFGISRDQYVKCWTSHNTASAFLNAKSQILAQWGSDRYHTQPMSGSSQPPTPQFGNTHTYASYS